MATTSYPPTVPDQARASAHLRPLDTAIISLEESQCTWCMGLLRLLKAHLENDIEPVTFGEVR